MGAPTDTTSLTTFVPALLAALAGSLHCVGMCGSFVLAAAAASERGRLPWRLLGSQTLYHVGKTMTYLFLGALAGFAGQWIVRSGSPWRLTLAVVAALALVAVGAHLLGWYTRPRSPRLDGLFHQLARPWLRAGALLSSLPVYVRALSLGVFSGFLPCPLVYAFVAAAAATGSVLDGMAVLTALGLGTIPLLFVVALTGNVLAPTLRVRWVRLSGVLLIGLAVYTVYRGFAEPACCH